MKINILTFIFLFFLFNFSNVYSQSRKIEKADLMLDAGEYFQAREIYLKVYPKLKVKSEKAEICFKLGECSRKLNDQKNEIKWYKKAATYNYQNPLVYLYLGDAYKMRQEYEDALTNYRTFKDILPADQRGEDGITSCNLAIEWVKNPERYFVREATGFNNKKSDFSPSYAGDSTQLYFTSARETANGEKVNGNSGMLFTDIFYIQKDKKGDWSVPVPALGSINTEFDEGACSLTTDGLTMYFTRCSVIEDIKMGCKIYVSEKIDGLWGDPKIIPLFADSAISVGNPFITKDRLTLYFVAENPKQGVGGKDIWKIERKTKSADWGTPILLSTDINTIGNEYTPFVDDFDNLFFASDGHMGMGGLDIFKATLKEDKTSWTVENLKYPINSSYDDFGIIFNGKNKNGYFSSTRNQFSSDDIFYFWEPPLIFSVKGKVFNELNNGPLNTVDVEMKSSDGGLVTTVTAADGSFYFDLKENTDYYFTATKKAYLKGTSDVTTRGLLVNTVLQTEMYLKPLGVSIELENILYNVGDTTLREESKVSLEDLVKILNDNPTAVIEITSNTDFRGSDEANKKLSVGRANSVIAFLIEKGVDIKRLVANGAGETNPVVVDEKLAATYTFLKVNDVLNEAFITALKSDTDKDVCHQLNRRTEFKILSVDYGEKYNKFGNE